jgi:hypothetical protein
VQRFSRLYQELDTTTGTAAKVDALRRYFDDAPPADAAWATYFLAGGKPQQVVPTALLRTLACEQARIEDWLFEACYQAVGDLAETIALVLPPHRLTAAAAWPRGSKTGCCRCAACRRLNKCSAWRRIGASWTRPAASCSSS